MTLLTNVELQEIEGGINGLKVAGGTLLIVAGVGECATVGLSAGGVCTALGGIGCVIDGLNE